MGIVRAALCLALVLADTIANGLIATPDRQHLKASSNVTLCGSLAATLEECYLVGSGLPDTCSGKSSTVKCAEKGYNEFYSQCKYEIITRFADDFMVALNTSDKLLCKNDLYKEFQDNIWCWAVIKKLSFWFLSITHGYFAPDGCRALEFDIDLFVTAYPGTCAKLTERYLRPLYKASPCGNVATNRT